MKIPSTLAFSLTLFVSITAHASGQDVFDQECAICHANDSVTTKKGPPLAGIVGRKSGQSKAYAHYSEAMRSADIEWTPENLAAYLKAPQGLIPGSKMRYPGLPDAGDRKAVIDYLKTLR